MNNFLNPIERIKRLLGTIAIPDKMKLKAIHRRTSINKASSKKAPMAGAEKYMAAKNTIPKTNEKEKAERM